MNYSVFLAKVIVGVFPTVKIVDNPTLKFPQDDFFFLPILVANITFSSSSLLELALSTHF